MVGEPFDHISVLQGGYPIRGSLIIDLGIHIHDLKLRDEIGHLTQLPAAQTLRGILVNYRNLVHGKLSHISGKISVFHFNQSGVGS